MSDKTTLDRIAGALQAIEEEGRVFYGTASKLPKGASWDYTVFSRAPASTSEYPTSISDAYDVAVVREGHVPEGHDKTVIDAMRSVPGMKVDTAHGIEYVYRVKPGTRDTVEMMVIRFSKGRRP